MSKIIYKYPLQLKDIQFIAMPDGAQILTIQNQDEKPVLWALVEPNTTITKQRAIELLGAGDELTNEIVFEHQYISTFQLTGCGDMFHAFERRVINK